MRYLKIIFFVLLILNFYNLSFAEETYFIDMNKLLNQSKAGKEAQDFLKKKIITEDKKLKKEGELLKKEEIDLIAKKKTLSADEYKKTLNQLREKNIKFQRKRRKVKMNMYFNLQSLILIMKNLYLISHLEN